MSTMTQPVPPIARSQTFAGHETSSRPHNKSSSISKTAESLLLASSSTHRKSDDSPSNHLPIGVPLSSSLITQWIRALESFDKNQLREAISLFEVIEPKNSKIHYNMATIYSTLREYETAISYFKLAIDNDNYMAISYFQIGVCRFMCGQHQKAAKWFNTTLKLLRGNSVINYQQLGMEYKLYSCEIMYNRALSYIYSGQITVGVYDLGFAAKEKRYILEHGIMDGALAHFSKSARLPNAVNIGSLLDLPQDADSKSQRFSVVGPPRAEYYKIQLSDDRDSSPPLDSEDITPYAHENRNHSHTSSSNSSDHTVSPKDPIADETENPDITKEITCSLFSVPQGAVFRLTDTKVQSILNDKYLGALMMGVPGTAVQVQPKAETHESHVIRPQETSKLNKDIANRAQSPISGASTPYKVASAENLNSMRSPPYKNHTSNPSGSFANNSLKQPKNMPILPSLPAHSSSMSSSSSSLSNSSFTSTHSLQSSVSSYQSPEYNSEYDRSRPKIHPLQCVNEQPLESPVLPLGSLHAPAEEYKSISGTELYPSKRPQDGNNNYNLPQSRSINEPPPRSLDRQQMLLNTDTPNQPLTNTTLPKLASVAPLNRANSVTHMTSPPSPPDSSSSSQNVSIKVKIHFQGETRVMWFSPGTSFSDLKSRIALKLDGSSTTASKINPDSLFMRIKDEDDDLVLLGDQEDLDVVLDELCSNEGGQRAVKLKLAIYVEISK